MLKTILRKQTNKQKTGQNPKAKTKLYRQNYTRKPTHRHSQKEKKENIYIYIYKKKRATKLINKSTNYNNL